MLSPILSFPLKDDRITVNQSALNGKNYLHVGGDVAKQIWIPDIIIDKVREINDLENKNKILRKMFLKGLLAIQSEIQKSKFQRRRRNALWTFD